MERPVSIAEAFARFLENLAIEGRSRGTLKTYRSLLRAVAADDRPLAAFSAALCRSMIAERMGSRRATARTFAGALSSFARFCAAEYGIPNVMADVPTPRALKPPHRFLSPPQIQHVWRTCPDDSYRLLVLLLLEGLRASEAVGLRWRDVSGDTALVLGKGSRYRRIVLSAPLRAFLERSPRNGEYVLGYSYNALQWRMKRLGRLAGVRLHAHLLRHSFASNGLILGMDSETLRQIGGWSPASNVMDRYIESAREHAALERSREFGLTDRLLDLTDATQSK